MTEFLDIDNLLPELVLGLGLALLVGNAIAWWKHRQGRVPEGIEGAQYRPGRLRFLMTVGLVMAVWGAVSLITK